MHAKRTGRLKRPFSRSFRPAHAETVHSRVDQGERQIEQRKGQGAAVQDQNHGGQQEQDGYLDTPRPGETVHEPDQSGAHKADDDSEDPSHGQEFHITGAELVQPPHIVGSGRIAAPCKDSRRDKTPQQHGKKYQAVCIEAVRHAKIR